MLLAAMLAMVLAAAAPALAQTANAVAGDDATNAQYTNNAVCQNILGEVAAVQYGNVGDLEAGDDLAQAIAQEQNVSVSQVNQCLNNFATATATATAAATGTATATALPATGGPAAPSSVLALGAGALLVAGGLLARRIVR